MRCLLNLVTFWTHRMSRCQQCCRVQNRSPRIFRLAEVKALEFIQEITFTLQNKLSSGVHSNWRRKIGQVVFAAKFQAVFNTLFINDKNNDKQANTISHIVSILSRKSNKIHRYSRSTVSQESSLLIVCRNWLYVVCTMYLNTRKLIPCTPWVRRDWLHIPLECAETDSTHVYCIRTPKECAESIISTLSQTGFLWKALLKGQSGTKVTKLKVMPSLIFKL